MPFAGLVAPLLAGCLVVAGCSVDGDPAGPGAESPASPASRDGRAAPTGDPSRATREPGSDDGDVDRDAEPRRIRPADLEVGIAVRAVRGLAGVIGPRHATSPAFGQAADWVAGELERHGYDVRRQRVDVPAGNSWGVPVSAGTSVNLIATPPRFDPQRPHLVLGAHLDTVPRSPGAEDNASGVGVLLAVAEAIRDRRTRLPVVLVAFGAEEPRGDTDADHHYGSRAYVSSLGRAERRAVRGMLSLDRVGVGTVVPVSSAGPSGARQRASVLADARRAGVATDAQVNRSSDHWQFVLAGLPGIRIGSTPYSGYHGAGDVVAVVSRAQLARTGRVVLAWLG